MRDLLAYSSTIVEASQDFDGSAWLEYDAHFRKQLTTQSTPNWSIIDASLWTMHFVKATPKAQIVSTQGDIKGPAQEKRQQYPNRYRYSPYPTNRGCFKWNSRSGCQLVECKFLHCCIHCRNTSHTAMECPQRKMNPPPQRPQDLPSQETIFRPPMGR